MNAKRIASTGMLILAVFAVVAAATPAEASVCVDATCQGPGDLIGGGLGEQIHNCAGNGLTGEHCVSAE